MWPCETGSLFRFYQPLECLNDMGLIKRGTGANKAYRCGCIHSSQSISMFLQESQRPSKICHCWTERKAHGIVPSSMHNFLSPGVQIDTFPTTFDSQAVKSKCHHCTTVYIMWSPMGPSFLWSQDAATESSPQRAVTLINTSAKSSPSERRSLCPEAWYPTWLVIWPHSHKSHHRSAPHKG